MSGFELITTYKNGTPLQTNGYKIIRKLGEGSYSKVYLMEFSDLTNQQKPVETLACKVIDTLKIPKDFEVKFLPRELSILRRLDHPHIIRVHSIHKKDSKYLIFMRYAEYGDLLDFVLQNGATVEEQARVWTKQISLAVQYIHELEISHRDLKCENILITVNLNVKLSDFGFAKCVLNQRGLRTLSETFCGSPSYAAPEILLGVPYNPKLADIWSLGVIIFVILNKALPFDDNGTKKLYAQQVKRRWKFKPQIEAATSKQVRKLLNRLLEPDTKQRYTIAEVLNSEWLSMDPRIIGMTEEESIALSNAREERQKIKEGLLSPKYYQENRAQYSPTQQGKRLRT